MVRRGVECWSGTSCTKLAPQLSSSLRKCCPNCPNSMQVGRPDPLPSPPPANTHRPGHALGVARLLLHVVIAFLRVCSWLSGMTVVIRAPMQAPPGGSGGATSGGFGGGGGSTSGLSSYASASASAGQLQRGSGAGHRGSGAAEGSSAASGHLLGDAADDDDDGDEGRRLLSAL